MLGEHGYDIDELVLVPGSGGVFEVDADGTRLYSKAEAGRHAEPGEILSAFRQYLESHNRGSAP